MRTAAFSAWVDALVCSEEMDLPAGLSSFDEATAAVEFVNLPIEWDMEFGRAGVYGNGT